MRKRPKPVPQAALFAAAAKKRAKLAVDKAIRRGQREGLVSAELDAGLCAVARTLAESLDECAAAGGDKWLLARLAGELRETLGRLRLDPTARVTGAPDELADLMAQMAGADSG